MTLFENTGAASTPSPGVALPGAYPRRLYLPGAPVARPSPVGVPSLVFWVYLVACVSLLGLLNFTQVTYIATPAGNFNGDDILLTVVVLGSAPTYLAWRGAHRSRLIRTLEIAWLIYVAILFVSSLSSPVDSLTEMFVNLRFVSRFVLFFPAAAILSTSRNRKAFFAFSLAIAATGTLFNIAQATLGPVSLFSSPVYSADIHGEVGDLYRVYLEITNYIIFVFFLSLCASVVYRRILFTAFAAFLAISFLVIYYRSLWIALVCGLVTVLAIYGAQRRLRRRVVVTLVVVPVVLIASGFALSFLGINAFADVIARIDEGIYAYSTDTGTWGTRVNMAYTMLARFNWNDWLLGAGLFGSYWSDFGVLDVFLHVGVAGCLAVAFLMVSCLSVGIAAVVRCIRAADRLGQVIGGAAAAFTVTLVVYSFPASNFLQPYTMTTLAVATALASAVLASQPTVQPRAAPVRRDSTYPPAVGLGGAKHASPLRVPGPDGGPERGTRR